MVLSELVLINRQAGERAEIYIMSDNMYISSRFIKLWFRNTVSYSTTLSVLISDNNRVLYVQCVWWLFKKTTDAWSISTNSNLPLIFRIYYLWIVLISLWYLFRHLPTSKPIPLMTLYKMSILNLLFSFTDWYFCFLKMRSNDKDAHIN